MTTGTDEYENLNAESVDLQNSILLLYIIVRPEDTKDKQSYKYLLYFP